MSLLTLFIDGPATQAYAPHNSKSFSSVENQEVILQYLTPPALSASHCLRGFLHKLTGKSLQILLDCEKMGPCQIKWKVT